MANRRTFIRRMASAPLAGAVIHGSAAAAVPNRDHFKELGVRTFINAAGTYTALTASLMQPEVVAAIEYASKQFVPLHELQDKVGERIAAAFASRGSDGDLRRRRRLTVRHGRLHHWNQSEGHCRNSQTSQASRAKSSFRKPIVTDTITRFAPSAFDIVEGRDVPRFGARRQIRKQR